MKTLAIVVLVLVWAGLFAMWVRSRAQDGGFSDPVGTFNRHLRILEDTAPTRFPAANSRRPQAPGAIGPYRPSTSVGLGPMTDSRRVRPSSQASRRRTQSQKRRRDVFFALVAGVIGSLVLGLIPGLHVMLYLQVFFDILTALYVLALISMRNRAAERDAKLTYIAPARQARAARNAANPRGYNAYVEPAYSYHATGYDDTAGESYSDGYDYGDLAVRRAAN